MLGDGGRLDPSPVEERRIISQHSMSLWEFSLYNRIKG